MKPRAVNREERALSLDRPGFDTVVVPHLDAAYNLAMWLVRDQALAQDVVQDAAVRALGYFRSFRGGDGRAWLLSIVRNVAYDTMSARVRATTLGTDDDALEVADPAADPEKALSDAQARDTLDRAIAALPLDLRECLVLRELEDLSYKQIALVIDAPIGTVMSRLFRARQLLLQQAAERDQP